MITKYFAVFFLCLTPALAQETATIVGEVFDPAGSSIPGAHATVTSTDKGLAVRELTTTADGGFVATLLPVGTYSVKVEAKGFKSAVRNDIVLHADDKVTVRFTMEVGALSDTVTVEASAVNVELQSPTLGSLISGNEVRELSLNNRNYIQLISLMPGTTSNAATDELYIGTTNPLGSTNTVPYSINGARTSGNSYMVDGADNVDRGSNLTLLNTPSVDSIEEVKILRGQYSAEYGRSATGQINVVTKSGTNKFHGSAYEFFRNDAIAANNFFNNARNVALPPLRYNDFGYTIGGPIPYGSRSRQNNHTFFFWSEEFRRVITYSTVLATVPTTAMKQGIFPTPVCVQRNGSTCTLTSNTITNIDPVAKEYIQDVFSKIPSGDSNNSVVTPFRSIYNARQELIKVDHQFNERIALAVRFVSDTIPTTEPGGLFTGAVLPGVSTTQTNSPGRNYSVRLTETISPTLYNEVGWAYSYGAILSDPTGLDSTANSPDVKVNLPYPVTLSRIPALTFSGGSSLTGYGPYRDYNRNNNVYDNIVKVLNKHTLKAGITVNMYQKTENTAGNNVGTFAFTPAVTPSGTSTFRQAWANFLLGDVATFTQASLDITPNMHQFQWEAYFQDDYRMARNFTVNLGVRFSQFYSPYDSNHLLTNFDPTLYNPATAPRMDPTTGNIIAGSGDTQDGIIINGQNSPYGTKVSNQDLNKWAPRVGFAWDPFKTGKTAIRGGYGISYDSTLVGIYEQNIFANPPYVNNATFSNTSFANPTAGTPPALAAKSIHATPLPYMTPYTQTWSFDVQRQFGGSTIVSLGYAGSKGTHLLGIVDIDTLPPGAAVAAGITTANAPLTSATTPRINQIRPYRGYNAISQLENWFNSNYNALQVSARKQFGGHGTFNAAYTWSKAMTDNSSDRSNAPQNFYARNLEYARATYDRTHVATFSYFYTEQLGKNLPGYAKAIVYGWELSGITTFQTGLPLTVTTSGTDWGDLGIIGSSPASLRPDMVGNPNANAPHTIAQWFNTAAYANVPAGQVRPGNASPRDIIGPGIERWDLSAIKNFNLTERFRMQFRCETFNTFNHVNPLTVTTSLTSATWGQVTAVREPRRVQLALKLSF